MKCRLVLFCVLTALVFCCLPLYATDYYVSLTGGNDMNTGLAPTQGDGQDGPWRTLRKASQMTYKPGDRILLDRGSTWSDENDPADPNECELVLKGNANIQLGEAWITVEPYTRVRGDEQKRPHITRPSKDFTKDLLNWSSVVDWAKEHPGTGFDQYLDRTFIRIAIRITGNGWKIKGLEISEAEMGIANYINPGDGYWIEDIYMHDMRGLIWPRHPDFIEKQSMLGVSPLTFGAIDMVGSNVTVKDCAIIRNYDPLFIGGDSIHGDFQNALFENIYSSHMVGGGMAYISGNDITIKNCSILHGEHAFCTVNPDTMEHTLTPSNYFQGCWFGPDSFDICHSTNYVIDSCEIAYVTAGSGPKKDDEGCDQAPISIQGENVNITVKNSFIHDSRHSSFGLHYGGIIFKQIGTRIENNVFLRNSVGKGGLILFGDAMKPSDYKPGTTTDMTFYNNRIYQDLAGGQRLIAYIDGDPNNIWDSFTDPKCFYDPPEGAYTFPVAPEPNGNTIVNTPGYDNYVPTPSTIAAADLVQAAKLSQSSRYKKQKVSNLRDGKYETYWQPTEEDWKDGEVWIKCSWKEVKQVDRIRLFDRPEVGHATRSGYLLFSDGSQVNVTGGILDNGAMREVILEAPKSVKWVEFHTTRREGRAGIAEFRVYENSVAYPTVEKPEAGEFTCDFTTAGLGGLLGIYGPSGAAQNNINWSRADWAVKEETPGGNKCLFVNFQPMVWADGTVHGQLERTSRIFYLPPGKKLKRIDIAPPPASAYHSPCPQHCATGFRIIVSQLGASKPITVTTADGQWHRDLEMTWPDGPPQSNVVIVHLSIMGSPDHYGVHSVKFDNIVYSD